MANSAYETPAVPAVVTSLASLSVAANKLAYGSGTDTLSLTDITAQARNLLDDADAATMRTTLGVNPGSKVIVTGTTVTLTANAIHYLTNAGACVATIPATAAQGDTFKLVGCGGAAYTIQANTGQTVDIGGYGTTSTAGTIIAGNKRDIITLHCMTANTTFTAELNQGSVDFT